MSTGAKHKSVAVIGGGIAGIQCALDLAGVGIQVHLVEKSAGIGGHMAMLDKTFPTNDCSMCILAPKMIECFRDPNVKLYTCSEVKRVSGAPGGMRVELRRKKLEVDEVKCTGCGDCAGVCPVTLPDEFDAGMSTRKAVGKLFAQAVPNVFKIERYGTEPCREACPAGLPTQAYVALVAEGRFSDALNVIVDTMPFAGICGRVCPHPCEDVCNRKDVDEPVALCALKRAAADFGWDEKKPPAPGPIEGLGKKGKVAVIGAGPAGLACACDLARMGHEVEVFEAGKKAGGMLVCGIPEWRLPRAVVEREIGLVERLGVKIHTGVRAGKDVSFEDLRGRFGALFIAAGAHGNIPLKIKGEKAGGVFSAVEFLRKLNAGEDVEIGGRVVVIGGGNAAVDAARAAVRLGAGEVTIAYRRTRAEMPALAWEVDAAEEEGVYLMLLVSPLEVVEEDGRAAGLKLQKMVLGEKDESGRRRPVPVEGSQFEIFADCVISAIGQAPEIDGLIFGREQVALRRGLLAVDPDTMETNVQGVFAGGDVVSGPATVIEAVAAGKKAARGIDAFLNGAARQTSYRVPKSPAITVAASDVLARLKNPPETRRRVPVAQLSPGRRRGTFDEVEAGYSKEQAVEEAKRCLACGGCCRCGSCVAACEAKAINLGRSEEEVRLDVDAVVLSFGFDLMPAARVPEYGYGRLGDVITAMELERLLNASGPTQGEVLRPSDGKHPKKIAFIQCVGSRDLRHHRHCSAVCCMHAAKEAILMHEHDEDVASYVFYMDIRACGKGFQDYIQRAGDEYGVHFIRGRPGAVAEGEGGKLVVRYENTRERRLREMDVDLVVLCNAMIPPAFERKIEEIFGVETTAEGFVKVPEPLLVPCGTSHPGIFTCGFCAGPKDIPDSVIEAASAASDAACLVFKM